MPIPLEIQWVPLGPISHISTHSFTVQQQATLASHAECYLAELFT